MNFGTAYSPNAAAAAAAAAVFAFWDIEGGDLHNEALALVSR